MSKLHLATRLGLFAAEKREFWQVTHSSLENKLLTSIATQENIILVGTQKGILLSQNFGRTWQEAKGPSIPHIRWLAFDPQNKNKAYAGTEPAGLFVTENAGLTWSNRPEVEILRDKHHWMLPYSPGDGCVRDFAFHGQRGYAAVEVGGALRSDDGGPNLEPRPRQRRESPFWRP